MGPSFNEKYKRAALRFALPGNKLLNNTIKEQIRNRNDKETS